MKTLLKKIVIYSMIGLMQFGLGTSVLEASPRHDWQHEQRFDDSQREEYRGDGHNYNQERDQRIQEENDRHEREMHRRDGERYWDWHERQRLENERHAQVLRELGAAVLLYALFSQN